MKAFTKEFAQRLEWYAKHGAWYGGHACGYGRGWHMMFNHDATHSLVARIKLDNPNKVYN